MAGEAHKVDSVSDGNRKCGPQRWGVVLAGALLVAGGAGYRLLADFVGSELATQVRLDPPLATLPMHIGSWIGEDVPVREGVLRIAGNDDYVSRTYRNAETGEVVNLYIGYTARPRTMLRHRPSVCYPSAGWSPLASAAEELKIVATAPPAEAAARGRTRGVPGLETGGFGEARDDSAAAGTARHEGTLPVRIQSFLRAGMSEQRIVVLNYYVLNGRPTIDENSFWGLSWRDPQVGRHPSRYVVQVQIAAAVRTTPDVTADLVRRFAADSAAAIVPLLPGMVRTGEFQSNDK